MTVPRMHQGSGPLLRAQLRRATNLTGRNYTTAASVPWTDAVVDEGGWWSLDEPSRFIVPPDLGIQQVSLALHLSLANIGATNLTVVEIRKNGSNTYHGWAVTRWAPQTTIPIVSLGSGVLDTEPGDYWEAYLTHATDTSIDIQATSAFFIRAVGGF